MNKTSYPCAIAIAIAALAALPPAPAHAGGPQCAPAFTQKITTGGDVTTANQNFGNAVAIAGNVAVVGEPGDIVNGGTSVGSLSVFRFDGAQWNFEQLLPFPDPGFSSFFAERALDTDGQTIVAGDLNATAGESNLIAGAVYVWEYNGATWDFTQKLTAPEPQPAQQFGADAKLDAGRIFVGAINYDHPGPPVTGDTGAVLVYIKNQGLWVPDQEVFEDDFAAGADFGHALSVHGNLLVVSAFAGTAAPGSVVVFDGSSGDWQQAAKLAPPDASGADDFAWRIACIDPLTFAVACPNCNTEAAGDAGAVYVYSAASGNWQQTDKLFDPNGLNSDNLATSIDADTHTIIAGTPLDDNGAAQTGSASIFRRTDGDWAYQATLNAPAAQPGNIMGNAVAIQANTALVGVPRDDDAGFNAGAALFYHLDCPDDPQPTGPDLDGSGSVDSIDLNIVLADFGCTNAPCSGDTDGDGDTDSTDLNNILAAFGTTP